VTLRVPDETRDAASLRHFEDPEIVRWLLGGPPQPSERSSAFAQQLAWWRAGTNAAFSIDAEGHDERVGVARVMFELVGPAFGFAESATSSFPTGGAGATRPGPSGWSRTGSSGDLGLGRLQARTSPETSRRSACFGRSASGARGSRAPGSCSP
jgi:hypothetical protein